MEILNIFNTGRWPTATKSAVESADSGIESADSTADSAANPLKNRPEGMGLNSVPLV